MVNIIRQRIAEVFRRRVEEVGYTGTTLDDVAKALRISKKTIYAHFSGKREIYAHVVEQEAAREKARLTAAVATAPTCVARLETVLRLVLDSGRRHVEQTGRTEWLAQYEVAADAFRKATGDLIRDLVQEGMDSGEFSRGDAGLVERMLTAMMVDYLLIVRDDRSYDRDEELLERLIRFVR